MKSLKIKSSIFEEMVKQAKTQAPVEACGILAGRDHSAEKFYKMKNADNSSDHFMMVPQEQFTVIKDIRSSGLEMLAIYHSHPESPARPSLEDIRLALTPDVIYVILSIQDLEAPKVSGFLIEEGNVTEVLIVVENKE